MRYKFLFCIAISLVITGLSFATERIIGLLSTEVQKYQHELRSSEGFAELIKNFDTEMQIVDYNKIYFDYLQSMAEKSLLEILENDLKNFNITKVIIPGNYYNIYNPPHTPLPNRQEVTKALLQLSKEGKVKILGICGGMQGILHADGIEITTLSSMGFDTNDHFGKVNKIMLNPASRIAQLSKNDKNIEKTNNGWMILCLPDYHTEVIDLSKENLAKINDLGYKIVGFSKNGIIEIIEDKYGNTYFQSHPEKLVLNRNKDGAYRSKGVQASIDLMTKFFADFIQN